MSLVACRSTYHDRYIRNYNRVIWKETSAAERDVQVAGNPDPLQETLRSMGPGTPGRSQDSQRSSKRSSRLGEEVHSRVKCEGYNGSTRRRSLTSGPDVLSHSASLPLGGPQRAEVPACFGSGFLGSPQHFQPLADKSLFPKPQPGVRDTDRGENYLSCKPDAAGRFMFWETGRSFKTEAAMRNLQNASLQRSSSAGGTLGKESEPLVAGPAKMEPPTEPPWGFGGAPARVRAKHCDFYWGC